MLSLIIESLYFFLPVFLANIAYVYGNKINTKAIWIKKFGEKDKWLSIVIAVVVSIVVFYIQKLVNLSISIIDYPDFSVLLGFLMGLGVVLGNLIKSYYRVKDKVKEEDRWGFGQLSYVLGGLIIGFFAYVPPVEVALVVIVATPVIYFIGKILVKLVKR